MFIYSQHIECTHIAQSSPSRKNYANLMRKKIQNVPQQFIKMSATKAKSKSTWNRICRLILLFLIETQKYYPKRMKKEKIVD